MSGVPVQLHPCFSLPFSDCDEWLVKACKKMFNLTSHQWSLFARKELMIKCPLPLSG